MDLYWYLKRSMQHLVTLILVFHFTFLLMHSLPGGPASYVRLQLINQGYVGRDTSASMINDQVEQYLGVDPNATLWEQYTNYMGGIVQGDFGTSIWYQLPVTEIYAEAVPWTVFLFGIATLLTFSIGIILGTFMAYKEGSYFDMTLSVTGIVLNSIPFYLFAIVLLYFLAVKWQIFPLDGQYPASVEPGWNIEFIQGAVKHATLPALSIIVTSWGTLAISMRGNSIRVLGEGYLRVARLRGLSDRVISTRYVGRNSILPIYTGLMIRFGSLVGGSVVLESIFIYRGMGYYLFKAVNARDYPLVVGGFVIVTITVLVGIFIAEMTYGHIDPRATEGESHV